MKEVVIKRVEHSYPCRLVQSAVKVTFPGMKKEVLVSFMGYKEPDLMHVMRCKGICSSDAIAPVACVPTKRRLKKVTMHLKTQVNTFIILGTLYILEIKIILNNDKKGVAFCIKPHFV